MKILHLALCLLLALGAQAQIAQDTTLTIFFKSGKSTLDLKQRKSLESFVSSVASVKEVVGFADTVGSVQANLYLSRLRAANVWKAVGSDTGVTLSFYGEEFNYQPDLSLNRKVQILAPEKGFSINQREVFGRGFV